jgi:hypothetical protein
MELSQGLNMANLFGLSAMSIGYKLPVLWGLIIGTEMVHGTPVIFNQLTQLTTQEDCIKYGMVILKYLNLLCKKYHCTLKSRNHVM